MPMQGFSDNYEDNSTDEGFQFTFFCDSCREGYKTRFIPSKSHNKGSFFAGLGQAISVGASLFGQSGIGNSVERGTDVISQKFEGMTAEWHQEHEEAFMIAQNEAKGYFHRCPKCRNWACDNDWNCLLYTSPSPRDGL